MSHDLGPSGDPRRPLGGGPGSVLWRPILFALGWICLGIGVVGLFLPLLPGTVFLILAAACFTRSSPRFEGWLLGHPTFGPPIRQWRETGAIPRRVKAIAVASLAVSGWIVAASDAPDLVKAGCAALFVGVAVYILTRPAG